MKMNQIIRQKRIEKGLTQEQVALCLGVTAPAVNKWERGVSYPDITLLPPLARLLDTDLNTLMSFQDDLTAAEVALFLNHLADLAQHGGVDPAFDAAQEKLRQFPSSGILLLNTALLLDGLLSMDPKGESHPRQQEVLALYERAAASSDERISAQANAMLANRAIQQHDHETAHRLLAQIPDPPEFDKKQIQINLQLDAGALDEAARLSEEKLLSATNEIHAILMTLMEIAVKQNRLEDAEQIAEISKNAAKCFDLWAFNTYATNEIHAILMTLMEIAVKQNRLEDAEQIAEISKNAAKCFDLWAFNTYAAHFQLYCQTKQFAKAAAIFLPMLRSVTQKWDLSRSPLYRHIKQKPDDPQGELYCQTKQFAKAAAIFLPMLRSVTQKWDLSRSPLYRHIKQKPDDPQGGLNFRRVLIQSLSAEERSAFLRERPELGSLLNSKEP